MTRTLLFILLFSFFSISTPVSAQNTEEEMFLVAENAFEDGFYQLASDYVDQLFERYPKTSKIVPARLIQGQCYFFQSQYLKAYDIFSGLLAYSEYKDVTLYWLGETLFKGGDYKKAGEYYQQVLDVYPKSPYVPQTLYSLGWLFFEQKNWSESEKYFSRLVGAYPQHKFAEEGLFKLAEIAFLTKDYSKAVAGFGRYLDLFASSPRRDQAYFYVGETLYYQKDYINAIVAYAQAADLSDDDVLTTKAKVGQAWSYLYLEKFKMAEDLLKQADDISSRTGKFSEDVLLGLARLYAETRQNALAIEKYRFLIERFPDGAGRKEAYLGMANLQYQIEDYKSAAKSYQDIIDSFPSDVELCEKARFGLGWSYLKTGDVNGAVGIFQDIEKNTNSDIVRVSALTQIGDAYLEAGEHQKALYAYDQILEDYSEEEMYVDYVQYRQGIALLRLDQLDAAAMSFQALEANFPGSEYVSDAQYYLGLAYYKKNNWKEAGKYIQNYLSGHPKPILTGEAKYILAVCQFNEGLFADALKTFEDVLARHADESEIAPNAEWKAAVCRMRLGQTQEALEALTVVYHKYADLPVAQDVLQTIGDIYLEQGRIDDAAMTYESFIGKFPDESSGIVFYNLGQIYAGRKEYEKAVEALKKVKPSVPGDVYPKARLLIANIFAETMNADSALSTYQNILETSPEFQRDVYVKMAEAYQSKFSDLPKALESYQQALAVSKGMSYVDDAQIQFAIADVTELLGDKKKAVQEYMKIGYLYPRSVTLVVKASLRAARIMEDLEDVGQAKLLYQKVVDLNVEESKFARERLDAMGN